MTTYTRSYPEFEESVCTIVRSMPLKDLFFIPDSTVDEFLTDWCTNTEGEYSDSYHDYRTYIGMLMSIPDTMSIPNPDDIIFMAARRIVDNIILTLNNNNKYYYNILKDNTRIEDADFLKTVLDEVLERAREDIKTKGLKEYIGEPT